MTERDKQEGWIRTLMKWGLLQSAKIAVALDFHELVLHREMKTKVDFRNRKAKRVQIESQLTDEERKKLSEAHSSQTPHQL